MFRARSLPAPAAQAKTAAEGQLKKHDFQADGRVGIHQVVIGTAGRTVAEMIPDGGDG